MKLKQICTLLFLSVFPLFAFCQSRYNVHFGVTGSFSAKVSLLDRGKATERYEPMAANQMAATLYVEDENSFSLLIKTGLCYEYDYYRPKDDMWLKIATEQLNFVFNPEILFPVSNQAFKLGVGIGFDYLLGKTLSINGESGSHINDTYYYGNMDKKQRKIVPFINANCWYQPHHRVMLALGIKQPVIGSYYKNETMLFDTTSFNLKHQPTYFSFSVFCKIF